MQKNKTYEGFVSYYDQIKGFGFLKSEFLDQDVFFHIKEVRNNFIPYEGMECTFEYEKNEKGYKATKVILKGGVIDEGV